MKQILVATDFSTRADRALRRATLLAREAGAQLVLVHVVDEDLPPRLLEAERLEATALLQELAATVSFVDAVPCAARLTVGEPFQAISGLAEELDADLIIMGQHRRQALRDVFVGTTVERTIRESLRPLVMANAPPARPYERVLAATDFSEGSAFALGAAQELGFLERARQTFVVHAFDAPARSLMLRSSATARQIAEYIAEEKERARAELDQFLGQFGFKPDARVLELAEHSAAKAIGDCARAYDVDLLIVGTQGRTGAGRFFVGSVAEEVLRCARTDVLVVPDRSEG
jgi:nucleotide-binding universal stress UspA family protein